MTAMHTPRGLIHMNIASQGWTNAVAMVQRHMVRAMQPISPHITQPYIDDLAVKGPKEKDEQEVRPRIGRFVWDHVQDLCRVLDLLKEHNLTASGPKSRHCMSGATILGFVCDERGRRPDTKKTNKILEWPTPFETITEVSSFLGTCGFWRIFIKGFAAKTEQSRKLVRQGKDWEWGDRFVPRVDPTALVGSLKNFAPSDPTIARWLTYIWMFDFELERIPGNNNRADGLSQVDWDKNSQGVIEDTPPVDGFLDSEEDVRLHINSWSLAVGNYVTPRRPVWLAPPRHVQRPDLVLKPYIEEDSWGMPGVDWMMDLALAGKYQLHEDLLTIEDGALQVGKHEKVIGGVYLLANALLQEEVVRNTVQGQEEGDNVIHEREDDDFEEGEIKEAFRAEEYEGVYLELGMLLSCEMRERDACARVLKMRPSFLARDGHLFMRSKGKAPRRVVCGERSSLRPRELLYPRFVMDRGSEFTCAEVKTLLKKYGVIAEYTTAAHPQANAPVERGHNTITNLLAKWTDGRPNQWPNFLRVAFFVDNITVRRNTGYAPTTLWYGRHATFLIESFLKTWRREDLETNLTFEELLDSRAHQIGAIEDRIEEAASRTAYSRTKDKFKWDNMARVRREPLKVGHIVLLYDSSLEKQWSQKLDKRWLGPYRVTRFNTAWGSHAKREGRGRASGNPSGGDQIEGLEGGSGIGYASGYASGCRPTRRIGILGHWFGARGTCRRAGGANRRENSLPYFPRGPTTGGHEQDLNSPVINTFAGRRQDVAEEDWQMLLL
ncbi:hypothetical protein CBR_g32481 [Chara braunii]|uniref:Integrase catalytic domain-containing protein n=1 Tax=Chara braunii TaxID=69332 RepID=A0A388LGY7_CHABU|nr:hypothetical protein CBR_g32481 [Chara braunii]|eukprot:GBG81493.1 hypothetical protein CBR_g32481 [Chara braunii]